MLRDDDLRVWGVWGLEFRGFGAGLKGKWFWSFGIRV